MKTILAVLVVLLAGLASAENKPKLKVYVQSLPEPPAVEGFQSKGQAEQAAKDAKERAKDEEKILKVLAGEKQVALVSDPDQADVVILLTGKNTVSFGTTTSTTFSRGYFGGLQASSSTRPSEYHTFFNATLVLPKANYHEEISGMGGCTPPQVFMCPNATKELGKAIQDWVKDNADRVIAAAGK